MKTIIILLVVLAATLPIILPFISNAIETIATLAKVLGG